MPKVARLRFKSIRPKRNAEVNSADPSSILPGLSEGRFVGIGRGEFPDSESLSGRGTSRLKASGGEHFGRLRLGSTGDFGIVD